MKKLILYLGTPFPSKPGPPVLVPGGVGPETNQTLNNIVSAVKFAHKTAFPDGNNNQDFRNSILKCRVYQSQLTEDESRPTPALTQPFDGKSSKSSSK